MEKISAVIITKNEEKNIGRCLESLNGVADEVIVVDSYSSDATKEICKSHGAIFLQRKFVDYSDAKNHGNDHAQFPFILSLDADEALSDELKANLLEVKSNPKADGYNMNRLTNYCGKWIHHCGWYPDTKLRLFRKAKAKWVGAIHETLELDGTVKHLKGNILHYSYSSIQQHLEKINHFTEMQAVSLFEKGKKTNNAKIVFGPMFEFFKKYILKGGILDGYYGLVISILSGYYKFCKYAKLKAMWLQAEG